MSLALMGAGPQVIAAGGGGLSYDATILAESSIVHYWKMNEASGQLADSKGSQTSNSASGTPTYTQSAIFSGSTSSILFAGSEAFNFTSNWGTNANYSFECFINATNITLSALYLMLNGISTSPGYNALALGQTTGDVEWDNRFGPTLTSMGNVSISTPCHIVLTWDNSIKTATGYVNGVSTTKTTAGTQDTPGAGANIGRSPAGGGSSGFRGRMSNAAYYNAALTSTQVAAHYAARNTP